MRSPTALSLLLLAPAMAAAQSPIAVLNLPRATALQILVLFGLLFAIGLVVAIYELGRFTRHRTDVQHVAETGFRASAERAGLTSEETSALRRMVGARDAAEIGDVFGSISVFETLVQAEVERILAGGGPDSQRLAAHEELLGAIRKKLKYNYLDYEHPLVSTRNISAGQMVSVFPPGARAPLLKQATVVLNQELFFRIKYPVRGEGPALVSRGNRLRMALARQNDGVYGIELTVYNADQPGLIDFLHTTEIKRNQLRSGVRIEVSLPVKFRLLRAGDPADKGMVGAAPIAAKMSDISAGGMSFLWERAVKPGAIVSLSFQLPEALMSGVQAKLLRVSPQEGKEKVFFKHHVQFVNIDNPRRERIVKFVFERMRQMNQWK